VEIVIHFRLCFQVAIAKQIQPFTKNAVVQLLFVLLMSFVDRSFLCRAGS